jgi:hypothetical protein
MKRDGRADSDGKGADKNVVGLPNPAIDARSVAELLRNVGFDVVEGANCTRDRMTERLFSSAACGPSFCRGLQARRSLARLPWSQSRRRNADLRTTNGLDGRVTKPSAKKKSKRKKKQNQRGLVSVTEKTNRISGISGGHAGSRALGNLDAHRDRRNCYRRGNIAVHAGYGGGHAVRGNGESQRGQRVADRSAHRQRLQMPRPGTRQGILRG